MDEVLEISVSVSVSQNGTQQTARATNRTVDNITQLRSPRSRATGGLSTEEYSVWFVCPK